MRWRTDRVGFELDGEPILFEWLRDWDDDKGQGGSAADHVVKAACRSCNSGWMSRLEGAVQPLLRRQMFHREDVLSPEETHVLARWLMKMTAVVEMDDPKSAALTAASREAIAAEDLETDLWRVTSVWVPEEHYGWSHLRNLLEYWRIGQPSGEAVLQLIQAGHAGYIVEYQSGQIATFRSTGFTRRLEMFPSSSSRRRPRISQRRWDLIWLGKYNHTLRVRGAP
ncbi:hypothetical protein [Nocardioides hwasunensis]|uniref:Uncharacterized protein n=1 Tax=Nocardioides hwasunensis TaxID=397258 RepID=A0ABR8MPH2_9ACTN|nr:hypothetical protein [Nocardioides hwasunensis]MBD3916009.1 hypothetical protein [Nocardioides hwasunensis]